MNRSLIATSIATAAAAMLLRQDAAHAEWTPVKTGIEHDTFVREGSRVHAIRIDLCAPGIAMRATAPGEGPRTTASWGGLAQVDAAINGDWWAPDGILDLPDTYPRGLGVGNNGSHFPGTVDPNFYGFFAFGYNQAVHSIMEEEFGGPAPWMQEVVSGQPTLLWGGELRDNPNGHCSATRARTSVGISADNATLYWAVVEEVDGSPGMTCNQMAALMQSLGAYSALNQDGGGSSTMWIRDQGIVNMPSDGSPRSLVTHWGVFSHGDGPPRSCATREIPAWGTGVRRSFDTDNSAAWGFALRDLILMSDEAIALWEEGRPWPATPRLVSSEDDPAVYLVDDGMRRHVPSPYAMATWRFPWEGIENLPSAELAGMEHPGKIAETPILVVDSQNRVWVIDYPAEPGAGGDGTPDAGVGGDGDGGDDGDDDGDDGKGDGGYGPGSGDGDGEVFGGCRVANGADPTGLALVWLLGAAWVARRRRATL